MCGGGGGGEKKGRLEIAQAFIPDVFTKVGFCLTFQSYVELNL